MSFTDKQDDFWKIVTWGPRAVFSISYSAEDALEATAFESPSRSLMLVPVECALDCIARKETDTKFSIPKYAVPKL